MIERGHPITSQVRLKVAVFGTGLALGSILIGAVSLPFFFSYNSVKAGVEIKPQAPKSSAAAGADLDDFIEGNYWALIIGINKYPTMDKDKQLEAARKDAEAISKLLVERYGFSKERMVELYDEAATRKGIIRAFSSLKRRLTDKDSLFIYYAGHGEYEGTGKEKSEKEKVDGMGYWIPSDAELDDPASYIFNSQVRDYLANIPARHIYAVVDSCFSGSLMGRTRAVGLSKAAIKELYQEKSRWVLASGGLYPVPDVADKSKQGHSTFAWHFMKILRQNTSPYMLAKDIAEPIAIRVSNEVQGQLPRSAPVLAAGDEGGQFVFRLKKELQKGVADVAALEAERNKLAAAAQGELSSLEEQLKKAEDALKKQQEEMAKRKQAMLDRIKQAQEETKRTVEEEEKALAVAVKEAEEKAKRDAEERQARLKGDAERVKKVEEERLAAAKKFEQEQKEREQKAKEAELARKKLEEERQTEAQRIAAQKKEVEERGKQAELARKKVEEERKAEEARLAELKKQTEEKERQRQADLTRREEERKAEEARLAAELKKREEAEKARVELERKKMEELRKKQEVEKESTRLAELKRQEEEARKAEEARSKAEAERIAAQKKEAEERGKQAELARKKAEEERKAEEARLAELKKQTEEKERQRQADLTRQEEARKAEEARLAELKRQEEEKARQRQAELKRQEEERRRLEAEMKAAQEREQQRLAELKKKQEEEERRLTEGRRTAEEQRKAEAKRLSEEKAKAETDRVAALKRQEEAARKAEEERLAALARETEEQKRKLVEAKKKAEEAQRAAVQAAAAKAPAPAEAPQSGSEPIVEATLRPFQTPKAKDLATLITIPAGEFVMGSKAGDGQPDESPQRSVSLDAYTIDKYEVTVEQYAAYLKKSGAEPPDFWERVNQKEDISRPVVGVDWLDAKDFCEFYGKQLPTEAQWEKAARGTDGRKYPWGNDDPGPLFANFASGVSFSYNKSLAPVGSYESGKSPYGVYDMVGNVWEWVLDNYDKAYYQVASQKNPPGPSAGDYKVIRGGSWSKRPAVARSAGRMYLSPNTRSNSLGFRCAGEAK